MKRFSLFAVVAMLFAACTQDVVVEITPAPILDEAPETLVVDLEGDDTRIQLQSGKTVWTKGDEVSVFYRSDANQKWQYRGETGSRTAELKRVDAGVASETMKRVVVVYPYNASYYINTDTYNVQATLPAVQHYLANSYGLDGNIMISQGEYNNISLKNVCGWLKLQLTGDGEKISSITLRGNNGEQVAGELYINSAEATAILASDVGDIAEDGGESVTGGAGANLSFDDVVLKEVTLDCGEGVTLGAEATAFYIALPPQTFTKGFKVEIVCADDTKMVKSSNNELSIERNTIQPMAAIDFVNPNTPNTPDTPAQPTPADNQIWYTAWTKAEPNLPDKYAFGADVISNAWDSETGKGIITFDGDVTMVGYKAFYHCDNFITITLPDSVTTIGEDAFLYCTSLTSVNIPDSVTTIGDWAFYECDSLTSVNIPDSVTTIGNLAFENCNNLTSVTIGNSVTTIGNYAFSGCTSLTSVNIGNSVTTIGEGAFRACYSLTSVNIPDSVTTIGKYAFSGCTSLTSVNIPESVTTIGEWAFAGCSKLKEFTGKYAADGGRCLIIDNTIIAYAEASGTTYNIPESVTSIGVGAFSQCISLTSVTIGNSVTTIGDYAFDYCGGLTYVYCKATTPPALGGRYVFDFNASGRRIIVPIGSGEAYRKATYWSEYANDIIEDEF